MKMPMPNTALFGSVLQTWPSSVRYLEDMTLLSSVFSNTVGKREKERERENAREKERESESAHTIARERARERERERDRSLPGAKVEGSALAEVRLEGEHARGHVSHGRVGDLFEFVGWVVFLPATWRPEIFQLFQPCFAKVSTHTNPSTHSLLVHKLTGLCGS